jgi:lysosomal acid lipase/cholesteryl ester hydrolase
MTEKGYKIETHYVTTPDGYILTMFRIPCGKGSTEVGPPVILQHGLLDSSFTWVSNDESESLGYILADSGFDVWFGNNRGNRYGRNHTTLDPDNSTSGFWDFSWDEMALLDVPSMIHFVKDTTKYDKVQWVGHSEGTTQMFAAASSTSYERDKSVGGASAEEDFLTSAILSLDLFVALAPAAYVSNQRSKVVELLANSDVIYRLIDRGVVEFLPYGPIEQIAPEICQMEDKLCDFVLMALCGPTLQLNSSRIQVYVSETPAGTSIQNMMHWLQAALTPTFQRYDFGTPELNVEHYGTTSPPLYDLSKLQVNTALFSGGNDYLADSTDVQKIRNEVPSSRIVYDDVQEDYAHLDFVWAYNANERIYSQVVQLLGTSIARQN